MEKIDGRVREFLQCWGPYFIGAPLISDQKITVVLKTEFIANRDLFPKAKKECSELAGTFQGNGPTGKLCFCIPTNPPPTKTQSHNPIAMPVSFDTESVHITRLENHYSPNRDELRESVFFLLGKGWTEKQFMDIGMPHASFFRYFKEFKRSQMDSQEENPNTK